MKKSLAGLLWCAAVLHLTYLEPKALAGYINKSFYPVENWFAIQVTDGTNTLSHLFNPGVVPDGTSVSLWDPLSSTFTPASVFTSGSGWSIDYELDVGEGARLSTTTAFLNTFVGELIGPPELGPYPHEGLGSGLYLLGNKLPYAKPLSETFADIIGRAPVVGEQVTLVDGTTSTFTPVGWSVDFNIEVMDAAFFNLVPEPTTFALLGLGSLASVLMRKHRTIWP